MLSASTVDPRLAVHTLPISVRLNLDLDFGQEVYVHRERRSSNLPLAQTDTADRIRIQASDVVREWNKNPGRCALRFLGPGLIRFGSVTETPVFHLWDLKNTNAF